MVSTKAFDMIYRAIYCIVAYILFVPSNGRGHILWLTENTLSTPDLYHKNLYLRAGLSLGQCIRGLQPDQVLSCRTRNPFHNRRFHISALWPAAYFVMSLSAHKNHYFLLF